VNKPIRTNTRFLHKIRRNENAVIPSIELITKDRAHEKSTLRRVHNGAHYIQIVYTTREIKQRNFHNVFKQDDSRRRMEVSY